MKKISKRLLPALMVTVLVASFLIPAAFAAVPSKPTGLKADVVTATSVSLSWNQSTGVPGNYQYPYGYFVYINGAEYYTPTYTITVPGLNPNTTYTVTVVARNADGNSLPSDPLTFKTPPASSPPPAPTGLGVSSVTSSSATLKWNASSGATSYDVVVRVAGVATVHTGSTTSTIYTVPNLCAGAPYSFYVVAKNASGNSPASIEFSFTTAPDTPTNFRVTSLSKTHVTLEWNAVSGATSYRIYRDESLVDETPYPGKMMDYYYNQQNFVPGKTYQFYVKAKNAFGESLETCKLSVTVPLS